jgi:NADH-quinone oxidoreductase subunit J
VLSYLPIGGLVGAVLLVELLTIVGAWVIGPDVTKAITAPIPPPNDIPNTQALGLVLYTQYVYFFQAAGVILLVAMIGAIVLTLQHKPNVRRQIIAEQVGRHKATAIEIVKVKSGQGLP